MLLVSACNGDAGLTTPVDTTATVPQIATLVGTVTHVVTGAPVAGAQTRIGAVTATTGTDGNFSLSNVPLGVSTLSVSAAGFDDTDLTVAVPYQLQTRLTKKIELTPAGLADTVLLTPEQLTLGVAKWDWVIALVLDAKGKKVSDADVVFTSNSDVIKMYKDSLCPDCHWRYLLGVSPGTAIITIGYGAKVTRFPVTVK
jgi:hypothetical protein